MKTLTTLLIAACYALNALSQSVTLTSSNLPIVIINSNGTAIIQDVKRTADMKVIYNGEGKRNYITDTVFHYKGKIGIEIRGNMTATFQKKPYSIETRYENGENRSIAMCGMPAESDWLLMANHMDKTLMRNAVASFISLQMGRWASHWHFCEVITNGKYDGVDGIMERIKIDKNRLDLEKLTPTANSGDSITGGYVWEISPNGNPLEDFGLGRKLGAPNSASVTVQQKAYIKSFDDQFRAAMLATGWDNLTTGFPKWIDTKTFIDEIIIQEACKNSDAYGWSSYFHKDRQQRINAGPSWDFDQSLCNSFHNDGGNPYQWLITNGDTDNPFFWPKLFGNPTFKYLLKKRHPTYAFTFLFTKNLMGA